jgi:hypothetical protein
MRRATFVASGKSCGKSMTWHRPGSAALAQARLKGALKYKISMHRSPAETRNTREINDLAQKRVPVAGMQPWRGARPPTLAFRVAMGAAPHL